MTKLCISITIPSNNTNERRYAISTLMNMIFKEDIKIKYYEEEVDYTILKIEGIEKTIKFKDGFFNNWKEPLSYLTYDALPCPKFIDIPYISESDLVAIFGDSEYHETNEHIVVGVDIFASTFFMLSRWEEVVNEARDKHDRFPAKESIAYKYRFLERPVVNEYSIFLKNLLIFLGIDEELFRERSFMFIPTHDVDYIRPAVNLKLILADIIKRRSLKKCVQRIKYLFSNPYDTFDFLMDCSEKSNLKSRFYFMAAKSTKKRKETNYYLRKAFFKNLIKKIKKNGHIIGFHPGYHTFKDVDLWEHELSDLKHNSNVSIKEGRQHVLRFSIPETLDIWDRNEMEIDSTLGYADQIGFRCGTGDAFTIFNLFTRKALNLKERPLIIMDATLKNYMSLTAQESFTIITQYINIAKKYQMPLTVLFHNSSFTHDWEGYKEMYSKVLLSL